MFSLEPMIGKMLLPIVGGAPAGWMVSLAFFQLILLAGYFLAYLLARLSPLRQAAVYVAILGAGSLFLPVTFAKAAQHVGAIPGALDVFLLLTSAIALPFIALAATSSTLQRLFTVTGHPSAANPYFLYAASNLGSFAGLFLYPFFLEPRLRLSTQSAWWLFGYLLLIVAATICLLPARKHAVKKETPRISPAPARREMLAWVVLALVPSSLMMGLTSYATTEIISMPLLWVIPLGLYLLTFVIAFSTRHIVSLDWLARAQPVAVILALILIFILPTGAFNRFQAFGFHAVVFTLVALMCHLQLAKTIPSNSTRHLPLFYLLIATGGALGGILNAFIAPVVFTSAIEYPAMLIAACLLNPLWRFGRRDLLIVAAAATLLICALTDSSLFLVLIATIGAIGIPILAAALIALHPRAALIGGGLVALAATQTVSATSVYQGRNFYGVLKVHDQDVTVRDGHEKLRYLLNGTTVHGRQSLAPGRELEPTSYYTKDGPLGEVFTAFHPRKIAAVGLGAGTIACYGTPQNEITFFELNPQVQVVAEHYFTFLSKCGAGARPRIVLGDARLSLSRMTDGKFDLIILDAFSSDAVPTHLMTKEALALYTDHLTDKGLVLFHISNRHFYLGYPLAVTAQALGLSGRFIDYLPAGNPYADESQWLALSRDEAELQNLKRLPWRRLSAPEGMQPWTDDYNNVYGIMHF